MKKILFITVIMATLRHCEGFPPQMQQTYFPYTSGQALTFVSNEGDSLSLNVTSVSMDGPYNIGFGVKETCGPYLNVKLEGKINHTNHELNIDLFYEGQRENDYDVTWTPTYNKPYYSQVTIWAGGNSYCLAYLSYIDGRMEMNRIRSLHDTICYANVDDRINNTPTRLLPLPPRRLRPHRPVPPAPSRLLKRHPPPPGPPRRPLLRLPLLSTRLLLAETHPAIAV